MLNYGLPPNHIAALLAGRKPPVEQETPTMMLINPFPNGFAPRIQHPHVENVPDVGGFNDPMLQPTLAAPLRDAPAWPPVQPAVRSVLKRQP